jgi:hypothetical protein
MGGRGGVKERLEDQQVLNRVMGIFKLKSKGSRVPRPAGLRRGDPLKWLRRSEKRGCYTRKKEELSLRFWQKGTSVCQKTLKILELGK